MLGSEDWSSTHGLQVQADTAKSCQEGGTEPWVGEAGLTELRWSVGLESEMYTESSRWVWKGSCRAGRESELQLEREWQWIREGAGQDTQCRTREQAPGTQREGQRQRTLWTGEGLMSLGERSVKDGLRLLPWSLEKSG